MACITAGLGLIGTVVGVMWTSGEDAAAERRRIDNSGEIKNSEVSGISGIIGDNADFGENNSFDTNKVLVDTEEATFNFGDDRSHDDRVASAELAVQRLRDVVTARDEEAFARHGLAALAAAITDAAGRSERALDAGSPESAAESADGGLRMADAANALLRAAQAIDTARDRAVSSGAGRLLLEELADIDDEMLSTISDVNDSAAQAVLPEPIIAATSAATASLGQLRREYEFLALEASESEITDTELVLAILQRDGDCESLDVRRCLRKMLTTAEHRMARMAGYGVLESLPAASSVRGEFLERRAIPGTGTLWRFRFRP